MSPSEVPILARVARVRDVLGVEPDLWPSRMEKMGTGPEAMEFLCELLDLWVVHDRAEALLTGRDTPLPADSDVVADRQLGAIVARFPEDLIEWTESEHDPRGVRDIRRWAWVEGWLLLSQDEDLVAASDENIVPLLGEVVAECPKASYIVSIIEHHVRDTMHHALFRGQYAERIAGMRPWLRPSSWAT